MSNRKIYCTHLAHCPEQDLVGDPDLLVESPPIIGEYVTSILGVAGAGQTTAEIAAELAEQLGRSPLLGGIDPGEFIAAVTTEMVDDARFWPVDAHGREIDDGSVPRDTNARYWFRFRVQFSQG
jgi:hypothetical protein